MDTSHTTHITPTPADNATTIALAQFQTRAQARRRATPTPTQPQITIRTHLGIATGYSITYTPQHTDTHTPQTSDTPPQHTDARYSTLTLTPRTFRTTDQMRAYLATLSERIHREIEPAEQTLILRTITRGRTYTITTIIPDDTIAHLPAEPAPAHKPYYKFDSATHTFTHTDKLPYIPTTNAQHSPAHT